MRPKTVRAWIAATRLLLPAAASAEEVGGVATEPSTTGATMRTAGWVTMGGGVVALAGSGVMFYLAEVQDDEVRRDVRAGLPPSRDDKDAVDSYQTGGIVAGVTGLAAVTAGVLLVTLAPKEDEEPHFHVGVSPGRITLSGAF